jgi:uncharacterized membrane protein YedE/YeeE
MILACVLGFIAVTILSGASGCIAFGARFAFPTFKYMTYDLGICSRISNTEDKNLYVQVITIGAILVSLELEFYKRIQI